MTRCPIRHPRTFVAARLGHPEAILVVDEMNTVAATAH
jgi:hypothetical protein